MRKEKVKNMRDIEFDLNTPEGLDAALKHRKVVLHEDVKATAEIFRSHGLVVRVVYRKHYDPYLALYSEASRNALGDPTWIESANTAMREALENGMSPDVFFRHTTDSRTWTGFGNNLRYTIERRMRDELEAAA
tara:strand:- start:560 stop:961 length:402 start_codon:yes stop_codon:yes gene_type:complete